MGLVFQCPSGTPPPKDLRRTLPPAPPLWSQHYFASLLHHCENTFTLVSAFCLNNALLERQTKEQRTCIYPSRLETLPLLWLLGDDLPGCTFASWGNQLPVTWRPLEILWLRPLHLKVTKVCPNFSEEHFAVLFLTLLHAIKSSNFN